MPDTGHDPLADAMQEAAENDELVCGFAALFIAASVIKAGMPKTVTAQDRLTTAAYELAASLMDKHEGG